MKSSTHNYGAKIRNHEKRRVQMQDTGGALAVKRLTHKTISYIYETLISKLQNNCKPKIYS